MVGERVRFLCGLSQREIPHTVIVSDVAGGMVGVVHESETSRMGMRNANYLLTQYTLLEWFSGFNHSILKVFLHKYRRYVTNWIKTPLFIDRLPSLAFYFYNFLLRQNEYRTENFKNVLLIGQALVNRNSTVGNVWKLTCKALRGSEIKFSLQLTHN